MTVSVATPGIRRVEQIMGMPIVVDCRDDWADDAVLDELERLAPKLHVVVGDHRDPTIAHIRSPEYLRELVPDLSERDVFVCGPPAFTDQITRAVRKAGVSRRHLHTERFAL